MRKLKTCRHCGAEYEKPKGSGTPYCQTACRHAAHPHKYRHHGVWELVNPFATRRSS